MIIKKRLLKILKDKYTIIIIISLISKLLLHSLWDYNYTYDHDRNLLVIKELINYGTLTYYGANFVASPPMYYLIYALIGSITGVTHESIQFIEMFIYFLACLVLFKITKDLSGSKKLALVAFALAFFNPTELLVEEIDFYAISLLAASLVIYSYAQFIKKQGYKQAVVLGLMIGFSLLVKDSFFLFDLLIGIHYLVFVRKGFKMMLLVLLISFLVYLPWLSYLLINKLTLPWVTHAGEITGELEWTQKQVMPFYQGYYLMITNWPVMFIISAASLLIKSKDKVINLLKYLTLLGPIFCRLALNYFVLDHIYYLFIPLLILTALFAETKFKLMVNNKQVKVNTKLIIAILIVISFSFGDYAILAQGNFVLLNYECQLIDYVKNNLTVHDSVMVINEIVGYTKLQLLSKAKIDFGGVSTEPVSILMRSAMLDANILISGSRFDYNFLNLTHILNCGDKQAYVYEINKPNLDFDYSIKVLSEGKPLSNAYVVFLFNNSYFTGLTKNDGTFNINIELKPIAIQIWRTGFEKRYLNGTLQNITVDLKRLSFFITGDNATRY